MQLWMNSTEYSWVILGTRILIYCLSVRVRIKYAFPKFSVTLPGVLTLSLFPIHIYPQTPQKKKKVFYNDVVYSRSTLRGRSISKIYN